MILSVGCGKQDSSFMEQLPPSRSRDDDGKLVKTPQPAIKWSSQLKRVCWQVQRSRVCRIKLSHRFFLLTANKYRIFHYNNNFTLNRWCPST